MKSVMTEQQVESLWETVRQAGMSRREFLALLASGGAAAVLAACAPAATPTAAPTLAPTAAPTEAATTAPTAAATQAPTAAPAGPTPGTPAPAPAVAPQVKPVPAQFFIQHGTNAEMRFELMANKEYATPNSYFFVRNHTPTPVIDVKTWKLSVEGNGVERPFEITYDELLQMPSHTVTRYVECAGNGRSFFESLLNQAAQGSQWKLGAYGIAEWTGVKLSDLLNRAGVKSTAVEVMPTGLDAQKIERPMPLEKAMQEDTLLAYMMNGEILGHDHGFPARVVTPGYVGIANIKWVGKITVSEQPLFVDKNTNSYVLIGPDYQPQPPAKGPILYDNSMKSAIALPWPAELKAGSQSIFGYAWSPFGTITGVELSLDGGQTYQPATLVGPNIERAGTRWEFTFDATPNVTTITPRATDDKGNKQTDIAQQKWNEQGYTWAAVIPHPVQVTG